MDKERFKQNVHRKYKENINIRDNDFYNTHFYNNSKKNTYQFSKIAATIMISCIATAGIVYAGMIVHNYYQQKAKTDFVKNVDYDYSQDMNYQDGIYFKKVTSFEEYKSYQQRWDNLIEMSQTDFETDFIIITAVENTSMIGLTVSNITTDEDTLYIEFFQDTDSEDLENSIVSIRIPSEQNRDNIILKKVGVQPNNTEYTTLENLPKDYSKEDAIMDKCFVIENGKILSSNEKQLDEFIEKSKQNENVFIRIVNYDSSNGITITDVEYKNGKYYVCRDNTRIKENQKIYYKTGNEIIVSRKKDTDDISVYLKDEYTNQFSICNIY